MEKRALILSLVFPPDAVSTAQLFGEIAEDLMASGWTLDVITTRPHYNVDDANRTRQPITDAWSGLIGTSEYHGAHVFHTAIPRKSHSIATRVAGWMGFHLLSVLVALFRVGEVDVILAPSPPLTVGFVAWLIGLFKGSPFIYNVQELYPDAAVALGALKPGALLSALHWLERLIYEKAFAVTTIAPGMAAKIAARVDVPSKVRVIPNFVDTNYIVDLPKDNAFSREFSLVDKFAVIYAGNMGPAQGLTTVLDAASLTRSDEDIVFVFVGAGISREGLMVDAARRGLKNVIFVPQQPYVRVPDIYAASDLCIVPLAGGLTTEAVPSKVYRIMAAERRILAVTEPGSDLDKLIREADAGVVVPPDRPVELAEAVLSAKKAGLHRKAPTGREYVIQHADRRVVTSAYATLLAEAAGQRRNASTKADGIPASIGER
jgi:colanic acid biosynthesis glycosyl transferase WcaI